jgi:hypothetical protein
MIQATYKVVLEENLLPSTLTMFPNSEDCIFQWDNAPCHTARSIKVWMEDHQIKTLSWPAQSPDLNPIENHQIKTLSWPAQSPDLNPIENHQIKTLSWPAQSPDLNPIENLWNVIKRKMDDHKASKKAELLDFLRQEA